MNNRIMVVDDDPAVRELLCSQLEFLGFQPFSAASAWEALALATQVPGPEIVLSDIEMPGLSGLDLLRQILEMDAHIQVIMVSAHTDLATVRQCLRSGAYDYLLKPYDLEDLTDACERALERRRLLLQIESHQKELERRVEEKTREVQETRDIALLAVAKLAECRDDSTGLHLDRMQWYSRILAEELTNGGPYAQIATPEFVSHLFKSSPLHDIGKVAIPDQILLKRGRLTATEWEIMKTHTSRGGDTLREVIESRRSPRGEGGRFLRMAMEIAYDHHERWDGSGYPHAKHAEEIPLGARIVALADAYDAITSERPYKPASRHSEAVSRISGDANIHFDPVLVEAFLRSERKFELIRRQMKSAQRVLTPVWAPKLPPHQPAEHPRRGESFSETVIGGPQKPGSRVG